MAVINKDIAYMALPLSIRRGNPFPVDEYSVWYDMGQLTTYAQSSPVAYVGQIVTLVNEDENTVEAYMIQNAAGNLMKLASTTSSGDLTEDVLELQGKVSNIESIIGTKGDDSGITANDLWAAIKEIKAAYEAADSTINSKFTEYYNKTETEQKINSAISSTYKPAGSINFESLPTLSAEEEGKVYNILDAFTTNENFVEGAGSSYPIGTNIVCIDSDSAGTYKWDVLAGFVDLSNYETSTSITEKLNNKVDKVAGSSLVQDTLIDKLQGLSNIQSVSEEFEISAEGNQLAIKAISQEKITGLPTALEAKLNGIKLGNTPLEASGGVVTIPIASASSLGVVKSNETENGIIISEDGSMTVYEVNINKITQGEDDELVLNGLL